MAKTKYSQGKDGYFAARVWDGSRDDHGRKHYVMLRTRKSSKELERIIGEEGVVCRLGGDNFIMFFLRDRLEPVMNVLRGIPVVYDVNNGKRIMVTASAGIFLMFIRSTRIENEFYTALQK